MTVRAVASFASAIFIALGCSSRDALISGADSAARRSSAASHIAGATRADTLLRLGDSVYRRSPDSARTLWEAALTLAEAASDSPAIARALTGLGMAARQLGDPQTSRRLGEQALALKLQLGLRSELFRSYNALGLLAWNEERLADASTLLERAADAAREVGDSAGLARATINTGLVLDDLGSFTAAREMLEAGQDLARLVGDSVNLGRALTNLASLQTRLGDPLGAIASLDAARLLTRATGDSTNEMNALGQLALARDALGEPQAAFALLDSAHRLANRLGNRREEADDLKLIADLFNDAGDHRHALDYYARARALSDSLGQPEEQGNILRNEARAHAGLGNHRLALARALEALAVHRSGAFRYAELRDHLVLSELTQQMGRAEEAEAHVSAARTLAATLDADVPKARVALTEARIAFAVKQWSRVLRVLDAAAVLLPLLGSDAMADAMALRSRAFAELGQLDAAVTAGQRAIGEVERIRGNYRSGELRTSYASRQASIYADQALLLLRLGRAADAFQLADAARGRALLEHLTAARANLRAHDPARVLLEKEELLRRIDALVARLRERDHEPPRERTPTYVAITNGLADSLIAARGAYEAFLARSAAHLRSPALSLIDARVSPAQVQTKLDSDEALLEYLVTPDRILVFAITRAGLTVHETAERALSLGSRVRLARELVQRFGAEDELGRVMGALHGLVIGPVQAAGVLRGIRRLVIVPHGVLTYLPFAALVEPGTGTFLVERYTLLHAPTAAGFVALRSARPERDMAARPSGRVRGVVFAPFPNALPATRDESRDFVRAVGVSSAHTGSAATEARLRSSLESGAVIHVATHAVMNANNPLFSRLELAGDQRGQPTDNGRLEVHELLGLRTASPLVFLSGCETARGTAWTTPFETGEDFTTIGQALLYAGARNVVATLWRIDDAAAAEFARRFYAGLGSASVAELIAGAQRAMIADTQLRHPYLWAAFQITGGGVDRVLVAGSSRVSDKP